MHEIYIATISISSLLFLLSVTKIFNNKANVFLALLLLISILGSIVNLKSLNNTLIFKSIFIIFVDSLPSLLGQLSLFYVIFSIYPSKLMKWNLFIHFIPFLIALFLSYITNNHYTESVFISFVLHVFIKNIISFIYIIVAVIVLNKYKKNILNKYSYTENIDFKWLRFFIFTEIIIWSIYLILIIFVILDIQLPFDGTSVINILLTIFIFGISIFGIRYSSAFTIQKNTESYVENNFDKQKRSLNISS